MSFTFLPAALRALARPKRKSLALSGTERNVPLDGLRGTAIVMVLSWHYFACVPHLREELPFAILHLLSGYGWAGVPVFFVLSGFLIGRILVATRNHDDFFSSFFLRRACRILPPYVLLLAVYGIAVVVLANGQPESWRHDLGRGAPLWSYVVFVQNHFMAQTGQLSGWLAVTWSLALEEQFYLILPLVVRVVSPSRLPWALLAGVAGCWLFRLAALSSGASTHVLMLTLPGRADGLLLGAGLAWAWQEPVARAWLEKHLRLVVFTSLASLSLFVALSRGWGGAVGGLVFVIFAFSLISIFVAGGIALTLARPGCWLARLLSARALVYAGSISYFVYLFHTPVNSLVHAWLRLDRPRVDTMAGSATTLFSLLILAVLGRLSWRTIEGPITGFGRRWIDLRRQRRACTGADGGVRSTSISAVRTTPS